MAARNSSSAARPVSASVAPIHRSADLATSEPTHRSPATFAGTASEIRPFRFNARSRQSRKLQSAYHDLVQMSFQYTDKFPGNNSVLTNRMDITQKADWQTMRAQATQLLETLLQQSSSASRVDSRLTIAQCEKMIFACKSHRLVDEPMLVLCAMLDSGQRVSAKCVSMLLECIVKSPQWAAQSGETALRGDHPAVSALCAGRPLPSTDLRGVELALWMLEGMLSPTLRDRFEVDVTSWNNVLLGLIHSSRSNPDVPNRLQRARAFYERIPSKSERTHGIMLDAYQRTGMHAEHEALWRLVSADPIAGASPQLTNARLAMIHERLDTPHRRADLAANRLTQLTEEESALFEEAVNLWSAAKAKPAARMSEVVTGSMLKVIALTGDIPLMRKTIGEAIEAEQGQPLVFVHPACYGQLFDSMSESDDPARWKAQAKTAWEQMLQRHADAEKRGLRERAKLLRVDESSLSAYARYLQNTWQRDELERLWQNTPRHLRDGNAHFFLARLKVLAKDGDAAAANRIIDEMPSFNVQPNVQHFAAWIGCYKQSTLKERCAEAEGVWQRMLDSAIKPASFCYRELVAVYMLDGSPAQLAKIDRLYAEMLRAIPAGMESRDYQRLIKEGHRCRLPSEARKWSERAKAAGLWKDLDDASRGIVGRIDEWKDLPRDSKSD